MPALDELAEKASEIRPGSFADAVGDGDDGHDDASARAAADDASRAASDNAAKEAAAKQKAEQEKAAAAKQQTDDKSRAEKSTNPHLDEEPEVVKEKEQKTETTDEMPEALKTGMTKAAADKAAESWKSIKQAEKAAVTERDTVKAELEAIRKQLESGGDKTAEVEKLKKELELTKAELETYHSEIAVTRVEATPVYKKEVEAPIKGAETFVKNLAEKYQVSPAALLDMLHETDIAKRTDAFEELTADFKRMDQIAFADHLTRYDDARARGEDLRKYASTKLEAINREGEREAERLAAANAADFRGAAVDTWNRVQELHPYLRPVQGSPEWNAHLDEIKREIDQTDVNNLPVQDVAAAIVSHKILPEIVGAKNHFEKMFKATKEKLAAAEKKLEQYRAATPGAGEGKTTTGNGTSADGKRVSFVDAVSGDEEPEE